MRTGGFLDRIVREFEVPAFRGFAGADLRFDTWRAGLSVACDVPRSCFSSGRSLM
jgi:hypothetical protein